MEYLKQSTARNKMVFMTDSADHVTGKASLTLTITASKDGGAFSSITPTVTERGSGWYSLALTTSHTDTLGDLALHITATGADPTDVKWPVLAGDLDATVSSRSSHTAADVWAAATRTLTAFSDSSGVTTLLTRIVGTLATGTHNPQSGDAYARLGAPAGASVSADVAAVHAKTTNLPADPADASDVLAATTAIAGYVDTEVGAIKAVTDKLDTALELDGGVYRYTTNALEQAPTGGSAPTAAAIADAVWDEAISGHLTGGSTGASLNGAGSAGDPWTTSLPGAYGAGTAGKILGDNLNATVSSRASQTSVDDVPTNAELATALAAADDAVLTAIAALPTAAANAAALMDLSNGIETSITPRQALRLILAASAGKLSGAATTTVTIRNVGDSKNRITAQVDSDGNRTSVTTDAT